MNYIELFSGIGGFRKAFELLEKDSSIRFKCIGYSEIDRHALRSYECNFNIRQEIKMNDISQFTSDINNIKKLDDFDIITGGFPCQSFSMMGKQKGFDDSRGMVLFSIEQILKVHKPDFIILENVRHILKHNYGETIKKIISFFNDHSYKYVKTIILDSRNFGLPQRRKRVFIICSLKDINIEIDENSIIDNYKKLKKSSLKKYNDVSDILDKNVDSKYYLSEKIKRTILSDGTKNFRSKSQIDIPIARTLTASMVKMHRACQDNYYSDDFITEKKSNKDTPKRILYKKKIRRLTPKEALKLQGFDDKFYINCSNAGISDFQLYKQAGNAISVNTVYALMNYLFVKEKIQLNK